MDTASIVDLAMLGFMDMILYIDLFSVIKGLTVFNCGSSNFKHQAPWSWQMMESLINLI